MSARLIVVDDTDSAINYVGPWFQDNSGSQDHNGNYGPTYLSTLHGTTSSASLSYAFNGSQIKVWGTTNLRNDSGVLDPQWECFIDKISIGATAPFSAPENNWLLCEHDQLVDGPHVLTVNATVAKQQTFWFDQIQYIPSTDVPLQDKAVLVDNLDAALQFSHGWAALGGTANLTLVPNASLTFEFVGVSMAWYGFIPVELPKASTTGEYSIDGGDPVSFLLKGLASDATTTEYNQKFFETATLPAGSHKIVVTYLGGAQFTPLTLDYLVVQNATSSSSTSSSSSSGQQPTSGSNTSSKSNKTDAGAIAGGVVGGLVFLALAGLLAFFLLRRRRGRKQAEDEIDIYPQPFEYNPSHVTYPQNSTVPSSSMVYTSPASGTDTSGASGAQSELSPMNEKARREAETAAGASAVRSGQNDRGQTLTPQRGAISPTLSAGETSSTTRVIRHEDSGLRLPQPEPESVVEIPPVYTPG
ncbi:hypothetical protein D9613_002561 [Agrocybe pediades]|uniref:Epidermal growth factor receptor-like transmembrane-juxtamembrane segment domain-containing protein n=1 Tax=Agrocybe pediades TaxID=84607 RepID=A0A8H4QQE1_9AGAR|nr:hypothetical protein D9613_002561 [Agrocybe pediades]